MYSPGPVGYQIHIKKRRPGLIVFMTITIIGIVALILYKSGFDYNNFTTVINTTASIETDQTTSDGKHFGSILMELKSDHLQIGKLGISKPFEVEIKDKTLKELNNNQGHRLDIGTKVEGRVDEEKGISEHWKTDTPFSEPEYFSFGMGSSGMIMTNETLKETVNDTTKQLKSIFYVIVSSVDTKELAEKQADKFKKMSAQSGYVYIPSLNKYRVYIGYYSNLKEATSKSKSFQNNYPSYKPWIWKN